MNRPEAKPSGMGVGAFLVAAACFLAWRTALIPTGAIYAEIGPKIVPWIATALLGVLGGAIIMQAALGFWRVDTEHGAFDRTSLIWIGLGLGLNLALIDLAGFILASTTLFVCTAKAFGSARPLRDGGIGFTVALIAYVGFDSLLGYRIGDGLIENFL
jgi:putative tricarboxylic transport membrane protein